MTRLGLCWSLRVEVRYPYDGLEAWGLNFLSVWKEGTPGFRIGLPRCIIFIHPFVPHNMYHRLICYIICFKKYTYCLLLSFQSYSKHSRESGYLSVEINEAYTFYTDVSKCQGQIVAHSWYSVNSCCMNKGVS